MNQNIILSTDYHDQNCVVRWFDEANGKEQVHKVATDAKQLSDLVTRAEAVVKPRGARVVWIQESTTARPPAQCSRLPWSNLRQIMSA